MNEMTKDAWFRVFIQARDEAGTRSVVSFENIPAILFDCLAKAMNDEIMRSKDK